MSFEDDEHSDGGGSAGADDQEINYDMVDYNEYFDSNAPIISTNIGQGIDEKSKLLIKMGVSVEAAQGAPVVPNDAEFLPPKASNSFTLPVHV